MVSRLLLLLVACVGCLACIWDRDTLGIEAKGLPEVLDIVTGRFDRNPPLYYEMRLVRVTAELETHPASLALYDDAGAACDRLGRHDEAVQWMRQKAKQLEAHPDREHQYRYHANLGTFLVHGWLASGGAAERIEVLKSARAEIARAIQINPDAHFGREVVQLAAMDWMHARLAGSTEPGSGTQRPVSLGEFLSAGPSEERRATIQGLAGLVALGNAWESPDIFGALAELLFMQRQGYLAAASGARMHELIGRGKKPVGFDPAKNTAFTEGTSIVDEHKSGFERDFAALRKSADERNRLRDTYMLAGLRAGKHPDTDPDFWSDWKEPQRPSLSSPKMDPRIKAVIAFVVVGVGASWLAIRGMRSRWRRG